MPSTASWFTALPASRWPAQKFWSPIPRLAPSSTTKNRSGWVVGAGAEWAAWSVPWADITFKVEYWHTDFGSAQYFNPSVPVGNATVVTRDSRLSDNIVRAGVNLKFNWGHDTVAAKQ
jgi:outer membrane immunogenic protein